MTKCIGDYTIIKKTHPSCNVTIGYGIGDCITNGIAIGDYRIIKKKNKLTLAAEGKGRGISSSSVAVIRRGAAISGRCLSNTSFWVMSAWGMQVQF